MAKLSQSIILTFILILLSACGGGSGDAPSNSSGKTANTGYTIGGVVSGLLGNSVTIQNNGGDDLTLSANGDFTFTTALNDGDTYSVTVKTQPGGMMCSIQNGSGTLGSANIDNVMVNCSEPSLNQAAYDSSTLTYKYAFNSIPNILIMNSPADADWTRWAMLHDSIPGAGYRLYCFKADTNDTLYQFGYNASTLAYEYGYDSIPTLKIINAPADADPRSFAMLYEGVGGYHLYMRSKSKHSTIYQFVYNGSQYEYAYGFAIPAIDSSGAPADVDWDRWAMLHDGTDYREYAFKKDSKTSFYQFAYNGSTYAYGYNSVTPLTVEGMPDNSDTNSFAMLHDGTDYRFYFLAY